VGESFLRRKNLLISAVRAGMEAVIMPRHCSDWSRMAMGSTFPGVC
jgi:hypothetical protein